MVNTEGDTNTCRRHECAETALWRGLCTPHWTRWHQGVDALDLENDDVVAPPRAVWWPPARPSSLSQRLADAK
jgi:hypothetical protein